MRCVATITRSERQVAAKIRASILGMKDGASNSIRLPLSEDMHASCQNLLAKSVPQNIRISEANSRVAEDEDAAAK